MIKQRWLILIIGGLLMAAGLALWPGRWIPSVSANVTLISFTATSLPGQPEIYIEWETATEFDTVGFYLSRSDTYTGTQWTRISDFIPHEGDTVIGAQYVFIDENTQLNRTYYYRLEVINTDQSIDYHGPIWATAGVEATITPTPTRTATVTATPTRTPTFTPSPTATPPPSGQAANPTANSGGGNAVTPRIVSGATVTPRPTLSGGASSPVTSDATPTPFSAVNDAQPLPAPVPTQAPSASDATELAFVAPAPAGVDSAPAPAPTLAPPDAVPAVLEPVVIVTEEAPVPAPASSANSGPLILVAAAILLLGLAFLILRQTRP